MSDIQQLKRPTAVYLLALLFVLAPIGNLLLSFSNSGDPDWFHFDVLSGYLSSVSALDWAWLGLVFVTGILLFKPHKTTWTLSLVCLLVVTSINTYRLVNGDFNTMATGLKTQLGFSIFATVSCLLITLYSRFPYLDRRAGWFLSAAHRYNLRTPVQVVAQDIYDGVTASVSVSGVLVHLQRNMEGASLDLQYVDLIFPDIRNMKVKARVVEYRDNNLRLKFKDLKGASRGYLLDWLQSHSETGVKKNA